MAYAFTAGKFQAFNASGNPLAGGKVNFYAAGTSTRKNTYTTAAGTVANANPVVLDANGQAQIWLGSGGYKIVVTDASDVAAPDGTVDNFAGVGAGLAESFNNYGADPTGATDCTEELQAALTAGAGGVVEGEGVFLHSDALSIPANTWLRGVGRGLTLKCTALANGGTNAGHRQLDIRSVAGVRVSDLTLDASEMTTFATGMRSIIAYLATDYRIERCKFITPGAAVASLDCAYYTIADNEVICESTTGASVHDGVIDQWFGSHDFVIRNNRIRGEGIGRYGILVTGQDTSGTARAAYNFLIDGNQVFGQLYDGIWVQGRNGTAYRFQVVNNTVTDISELYGIALTDCYEYVCSGNITRNTYYCGIRAFSEATFSTAANDDGVISNNIIINANTSLSTDDERGSAIAVSGLSTGLSLSGNKVKGTTHEYAVYLSSDTSNIEVDGDSLAAGVAGVIINNGTGNRIPGGGTYTPTLTAVANVTSSNAYATTMFKREGNSVYVSGRLEVTPTAAASTDTQLGISLPVASNFTGANDAHGVASSSFGLVATIFSDSTNDRATLRFPSPNTGNNVLSFSFQYQVK